MFQQTPISQFLLEAATAAALLYPDVSPRLFLQTNCPHKSYKLFTVLFCKN